jgi:hypothetical protein
MTVHFDEEFIGLAKQITAEAKSPVQWAEIEADDMFRSTHFEGGYDATEQAFCFSYYNQGGDEFWFQLTINEMIAVANGGLRAVSARPAE